MKNTLTRSEIAQAVHLEIGLSKNDSSKLVEDVIEKMTECFVKGENVKLSSCLLLVHSVSVQKKKELEETQKLALKQEFPQDV